MIPLAAWHGAGGHARLFAFAEVGDSLSLTPAPSARLSVSGDFAEEAEMRTAALAPVLEATPDARALRAALKAVVPEDPGLGGATPLLAACLRGRALLGDAAPPQAAAPDVAACLSGRAAMASPDACAPVSLPVLNAVLALPPSGPCAPAQALSGGAAPPAFTDVQGVAAWLTQAGLDREDCAHLPGIVEALYEFALSPGCLSSAATPGGRIVFGLYADHATAVGAASHIAALHRDWWVVPTSLS